MTAAARAVLWDMDGTLYDAADMHFRAWVETLGREGRSLDRARFDRLYGRRNDAILRDWLGSSITAAEIDRIAGAKEARFRELVGARGVALLPGAGRWLERLRAAGWRQALASAAPRRNVDAVLGALGVAKAFDAVVAGEDVHEGKPDPAVFLLAAGRLGAPPGRCVVVEDGPAGIEAARRAGMRAVGLLTTHAALAADVVAGTPADLPDDGFDRLVE